MLDFPTAGGPRMQILIGYKRTGNICLRVLELEGHYFRTMLSPMSPDPAGWLQRLNQTPDFLPPLPVTVMAHDPIILKVSASYSGGSQSFAPRGWDRIYALSWAREEQTFNKSCSGCWVWGYMPVVPTRGRGRSLGQAHRHSEWESRLCYVRSRLKTNK